MRAVSVAVWALVAFGPRLAAQQRPISLTETAARLAEQGVAQRDARVVLAAAEILRVVERGTTIRRVDSSPPGPRGPWPGALSREALLRLASRLATDQEDWSTADYIAGLFAQPPPPPPARGATGGPVWADTFLAGGGEAAFTVEFDGGEVVNQLRVSAAKARATLECSLFVAPGGDPAVRVRSLAGTCALEWRQAMRGHMTLRIRNLAQDAYLVVSSN